MCNKQDAAFSFLNRSILLAWNLESFRLNLWIGNIGDRVVMALVQGLLRMRHLRSLELWLGSNDITDAGARMLADFLRRSATTLATARIDLTGNKITNAGAKCLHEAAAAIPNIRIHLGGMSCDEFACIEHKRPITLEVVPSDAERQHRAKRRR